MRKFIAELKKITPIQATILSLLTLVLLATPTVVKAGYSSHNQPPFDICNPDQKEGSLSGVVFNNYINTDKVECLDIDEPIYGDERGFYTANYTNVDDGGKHVIDVEPGQEITLSFYIHNNAHPSLNDSGEGVAEDTRVSVFMPTAISQNLRSIGTISTDPSKVAEGYESVIRDTVDFKSDTPVYLDYVEDTTTLFTHSNAFKNGINLKDDFNPKDGSAPAGSIFHPEGALIGYDELNGEIPGCFEYQATIAMRVVVKSAEIEFDKQVTNISDESQNDGDDIWHETVNAKPGDKLGWYLPFKNVNTVNAKNLTVRDVLPAYLDVVPGSVRIVDASRNESVPDDVLFGTEGYNAETYTSGSNGYFYFETIVSDDFAACEAVLKNTMFVEADGISEDHDQATVKVTKDNCEFTCDQLTKEFVRENTYKFNMKATANEAEVQKFVIDFGDGNTQEVTEFTVQDENMYLASVEHEYDELKAYNISFKVVTSDGEATSELCKESITVDEEPTELPNTGPAATVAAVIGTGALGQATRMFIQSRRALAETLLNR